jgi:hypothetical protein
VNSIAFRFGMTLLVLISVSFSTLYAQKEAEIVNKLRLALRDCALDIPEPPIIGKGTFMISNMSFGGSMYYYHKPRSRVELTIQNATFISVDNDTIHWDYNLLKIVTPLGSPIPLNIKKETSKKKRSTLHQRICSTIKV